MRTELSILVEGADGVDSLTEGKTTSSSSSESTTALDLIERGLRLG
jgi:hypothetical protein